MSSRNPSILMGGPRGAKGSLSVCVFEIGKTGVKVKAVSLGEQAHL